MSVTAPAKLSRREAAEYIGTTYATLCSWATLGRGPKFVKIGSKVIYLQSELDAWMESRSTNCSSSVL